MEAQAQPTTNGIAAAPTATAPAASTPSAPAPVALPSTAPLSTQTNASDKRPRDARLIHLLLSSLGVTAYSDRVPLQLLDFSYRHTSSLLSDALHLSSDAYISQSSRAKDTSGGAKVPGGDDNKITMSSVQLAIQSRLQYQLAGQRGMSKEFLGEVAQERNKIRLPVVGVPEWGVRLPAERFVLSGVPWGVKEVWEKREDSSEEDDGDTEMKDGGVQVKGEREDEEMGEEVEGGTMEDVFGVEEEDELMEE
jgi:transcription initiation factor TFIID subunit 9B